MNTQALPSKKASFQQWHKETIRWVKEFDLYIYELNELKKRVDSKKVKDHIDVQVQKNIVLITKTTQDRLLKDVLDGLQKHKAHFTNLLQSENQMEIQNYKEAHLSLTKRIRQLRGKLGSLKTRISDFLNSESRIQRHGYSY
ncbi:hypothetical protein [Aureibaculum luteum]|uniref:hypothetical protein n=1 Tax=Aureibaculum luteum TaxID=1548456 RepID=UPI000E50AA7C|nr:hypothetical protein [Aureibaculum luteum]